MVSLLFAQPGHLLAQFLVARGRHGRLAVARLATVAVNLLLSIAIAFWVGLWGVAVATLVTEAAFASLVLPYLLRRRVVGVAAGARRRLAAAGRPRRPGGDPDPAPRGSAGRDRHARGVRRGRPALARALRRARLALRVARPRAADDQRGVRPRLDRGRAPTSRCSSPVGRPAEISLRIEGEVELLAPAVGRERGLSRTNSSAASIGPGPNSGLTGWPLRIVSSTTT